MRALKIAAAGMTAQQMRVEVISNNLANMNTTGYNPRRAEFADLHYQQLARPGTINASDGTVLPTGVQLGLGVRASSVSVSIEVSAGGKEAIYEVEPKLRDSFLQAMFDHANIGGFSGNFTSGENLRPLREELVRRAKTISPSIARDVLIIDIVRQDV